MESVSIVIVNYNTKAYLKACLDSIRLQSFRDFEVIVVDNASTDGSVDMVRIEYTEALLIRNSKNELYCKGMNEGIKKCQGEFILGLNTDVVLEKNFLEEGLKGFQIGNRIGMVSGKILRMDKRTIDSTGLFLGKNRKPVERGYGQRDRGQYNRPGCVFGVNGAVGFYRRACLEDISKDGQYFDEDFGMYYEDLDLCWRAQKKGWLVYYNPWAVAYHVRGGTAIINKGKGRPGLNLAYLREDLKRLYIINRYRCMMKNDSLAGILINLPFILWYEVKIWSYFVLRNLRLDDWASELYNLNCRGEINATRERKEAGVD